MNKKIAIIGCKHTTRDVCLGLLRNKIKVDYIITISPEKATEQKVSGHMDLTLFGKEHNIPIYCAETYNLSSPVDKENILRLQLDLIYVVGWQRLIPDWFIASLSTGAFGIHGSSKPLPYGRGRSPINWSILLGKNKFITHLFKIMPGVDDGPVVFAKEFDITPFDDCHTIHLKNVLCMIELGTKYFPKLLRDEMVLTPQPSEGATYYPKRNENDGVINWNRPTLEIYNFIRALTKPYPGAFTYLNGNTNSRINIWSAIPFDTKITYETEKPGTILEIFYDGTFLVKTMDSTIYVKQYDGPISENNRGNLLEPLTNHKFKNWENLPD